MRNSYTADKSTQTSEMAGETVGGGRGWEDTDRVTLYAVYAGGKKEGDGFHGGKYLKTQKRIGGACEIVRHHRQWCTEGSKRSLWGIACGAGA